MLDVLIIGAGPTGLSAAIELQRLGKTVRIIDKNSSCAQNVRATGVNPQTLMLFQPSGITEKFLAQGIKVNKLFLRSGIHPINELNFSCLDSAYPFMLSLPQNKIEKILLEHLENLGIAVNRGTKLISFTQNDHFVKAFISYHGQQEEVNCRYMLAADGAHSLVRQQLGIAYTGDHDTKIWGLLDAEMEWAFPQGNIFMSPGSLLIVLPIGANRYCAVSNCQDVASILPANAHVKKLYWQANFHVGSCLAANYQQGRIFLAGDAAHIFPPAGGRGMNLGIEDGIIFARLLASHQLQQYNNIRRDVAFQVIQDSNILVELSALKKRFLCKARDYILAPVVQTKFIQKRFCMRLTGLGNSWIAENLIKLVRKILTLFNR